MAPTTPQREVIEISDSPTAHPEVIEISDDEVSDLLNYRPTQINIPRISPIQPACEPEGDDNPESIKSELVDIKSSGDRPMVSLGLVTSFQSLSSGHGHPAEVDFCVDVLDRELGKISREMEEDQAFTTAHILRDAQFQFQLQPIFTGVANQVYSLQSLEPLRQGGASTSSINVVHYTAKKSRSLSRILTAKTIQTPARAVTKYNYYVEIDRSMQANRTRLPPEPSIQDSNSHSKEELDAALRKSRLLCAKLAKQSRRSENLSRIGAYLPQIRSVYQDCRNCLEKGGIYESLDHKDVKHPSYHVEKAFGMPLGSFFYLESPAAKLQKPTVSPDPLAKTLERYARESCLICSAHQCHIHGKFEDDDGNGSEASDTTDEDSTNKGASATYQLYSMPHTRMRTHYRGGNPTGNESEEDSDNDRGEQSRREYCSAACHLNLSNVELGDEGAWTEEDDASMQVLAASIRIRRNRRASCLIAPMLGRPCSEVYRHLQKLSSQHVGLDDVVADDGRRSKKFDWRDLEGEHVHHERLQPRPCYHPGQDCFAAGEKCTCAMHDTLDAVVPSHAASKSACAAVSIENATRTSAMDAELLSQLGLKVQSRIPIATTVKFNAVRGKGEPVKKGDFIAEYVGEIIGEPEVKRRDALVERIGNSYHFQLNAEMTIDAMWFGNATRFINHSEVRKNCRAEVLLVNSEHRIAFFATENIDAGEELFFDYGKEFNEKLKEGGVTPNTKKSSKQGGVTPNTKKSSKQQRTEPLESIRDSEDGLGSGVNEDGERGDVDEGFPDWLAAKKKRASDDEDDDDYIERGSQQGPKRARSTLRNNRGRR
ncbi:hypothetical protein V502_06546 [Pseudogymnoascus sp. VKM F-4520 (FW-2644)]|nr:hypothetical protein V502_06546 [Pseudogymnoascus sp. VKM F-4520 (FW-2644)]